MNEEKHVPVRTKIKETAFIELQKICENLGVSVYKVPQLLLEQYILYMGGKDMPTDKIQKFMEDFNAIVKDSVSLVDDGVKLTPFEATYYLRDESGNKQGVRAMMASDIFFGKAKITWNINIIAERFFCLVFPKTYKLLRAVGAEEESKDVIDTLDKLLRFYSNNKDFDTQYINSLFEDNQRSEYGKKMHDVPYVRHNNFNLQLELKFIEDEREERNNDAR